MKIIDLMTTTTRTQMKTKEQIYDYFEKAINAIPEDHPNYHEVRRLLISQVNDDLTTYAANSTTNRRAS
jgi:hypothetical protein